MNISNGLMMQMMEFTFKGLTATAYIYVYEYHKLYELPWNSVWTWLIGALSYDCGYYWFHRAAHGETDL